MPSALAHSPGDQGKGMKEKKGNEEDEPERKNEKFFTFHLFSPVPSSGSTPSPAVTSSHGFLPHPLKKMPPPGL